MKSRILVTLLVITLFSAHSQLQAANQVLRLVGEADSFFEVPDDDSLDLDLETAFTVEAWVNPADWHGEDLVVNKEDAYEFAVVNGNFDVAVRPLDQQWEWHHSSEEVPIDQWSHLAITWDGELINMFFNGEWVGEGFKPGDGVNDSPDTLKVGRRTRGDDTHSAFEGLVDEVRISNIVRYPDDGFDPPTKAFTPDENTVALYHFDEHDNGVVSDASSFGNHGRLLGEATLVPDDFLASAEPGDYNENGKIDAGDLDLHAQYMKDNNLDGDVNGDGVTNLQDRTKWIHDIQQSWAGDSNFDGEFNSSDLVAVFTAGKYETGQMASYDEGDWNGDMVFDSSDLVYAFADGGYEAGERMAGAAVVPEPSSLVLWVCAVVWFTVRRPRVRV